MSAKKISRRGILSVGVIAAAGVAVEACQPKVVEKIVEKTVVIEKPIEKEKIVEKEKEVTKVVEKVVEKEKVVTPTPEPCTIDWAQKMPPVPKKYNPVLEISLPFNSDFTFKPGSSNTNNPWYNWTLENMGIRLKVAWESPYGQRQTKLQTDLAAGTMPDMINVFEPLFGKMVDDGAIKDIKAIWEATASPLVKKSMRYPDGTNWGHCFRNGRKELYGLDFGLTDKVFCTISFIRRDWLKKVGMSMPQTVADWDKTLHAFHDQKLCQFGITAQKDLFGWANDWAKIFGAWRVMPTVWRDYGDGKLVYDSLSPKNKEPLALLSKWYKDGLISPDFPVTTWAEAWKLFSEEKAGIATGPMWGTAGLTVDVEKARPGADVAVMPLPTGPTGERGRKATKQMYHVWVFRRGLEDIKVEALLNQLNYYVEYHTNGPEKYECYGPLPGTDDLFLKGYDWDWDANCNVKRLQWNTGQEFRDAGFWHATYIDYQRVINEAVRTFSKMDPTKRNKPQKYFTADPGTLRAIDAYQTLFDEEQYEIGDQYFGVPTARMRELLPVLDKLELEYYTTIITGNKPLGAFDEFVSEWRKRGGDQVTADINAWYASRSK